MSLSKRRAQKSLNQSTLSQASNTQNMRDSSLFKNDALAQIRNIHYPPQTKSSRNRQIFQPITNKKKTVRRNQYSDGKSKQHDRSKQNKIVNYVGLSKIVDQKNLLIVNQQKQIQNLKVTLQRVRKQLQKTRIEFENKKLEDMAALKRQEKQNQQNIQQLEILRVGIRQLKSKIESLQHQKQHNQKKSTQYLKQNQQLTIKLTSLKQEYVQKLPDQKLLQSLKQQLLVLKQQSKLTKQLQIQKSALEQRCRNFERKINDYIIRYNQVQSDYNQVQIKYYRAQKENDDISMNLEQLEVENRNLKKMLDEEKKILVEQTDKWRARMNKLEEHQKCDKSMQYSQVKMALSQLQDRYGRLEVTAILEQKLDQKQKQIHNLQIKTSELVAQLQQTKQSLLSCESQLKQHINANLQIETSLQNTISNIKQTHKLQLSYKQKQIEMLSSSVAHLKNKLQKQKQIYIYQNNKLVENYKKIIEQKITEINNINHKKQQSQESRVKEQESFKKEVFSYQQQNKEKQYRIQELYKIINQKQRKVEQLSTSINQYETKVINITNTLNLKQQQRQKIYKVNTQISAKLQQNCARLTAQQSKIKQLQLQLSEKHQQLCLMNSQQQITNSQMQIKQLSILQKLQKLQSNIQQMEKKQKNMEQQIQALKVEKQNMIQEIENLKKQKQHQLILINQKNTQISRMQAIIGLSNAELRQIKALVQEYKQKIQQHNNTILENDRKIQNQIHQSKQQQLKYQEQVTYYKQKYQQNFNLNMELSNKACQYQRQISQNVSRNTQLLKVKAALQTQLQNLNGQKYQIQNKMKQDMDIFVSQNIGLKRKLHQLEIQADQSKIKILESQSTKRDLQLRITNISDQIIKMRQHYQRSTANLQRSHSQQLQNIANCHIEEISLMKQTHSQQLQTLIIKHNQDLSFINQKNTQQQKQQIQFEQFKYQKQLKSKIEYQQSLLTKMQQMSHELQQKDKLLQQNYEIIFRKQKEIQNMTYFKSSLQSQQVRKVKQYNIKLSQQVQQVTSQFNKNYQQLRQISQQSQKYRSNINILQRDINNLQNRNIELSNEINILKCEKYQQVDDNCRVVNDLKCQIASLEQRLKFQMEETTAWIRKYQITDKQLRKIQQQCTKINRNLLEESTRKNKQNNRQIDNYRTQIMVLKEENSNLQKVMDRQLGKRKSIIEQLIHEKKILYEQIGHR